MVLMVPATRYRDSIPMAELRNKINSPRNNIHQDTNQSKKKKSQNLITTGTSKETFAYIYGKQKNVPIKEITSQTIL